MRTHSLRIGCMIFLLFSTLLHAQQAVQPIPAGLTSYFSRYQNPEIAPVPIQITGLTADDSRKTIVLQLSENFAYQPLRTPLVESTYENVKTLLPPEYRSYKLSIRVKDEPIENLVPNFYRSRNTDKDRQLGKLKNKEPQWVKNLSRPTEFPRGLEGTHLSLWQSHGRYYKPENDRWQWQRPSLFCTTEDLFTPSIVLPYLIPMLENAGGIVYTPRERDTQRNEVIVDNDTHPVGSFYIEKESRKARFSTPIGITGFASRRSIYQQGENPFTEGTVRILPTESKAERAFAMWAPNIPEEGYYAVYVSYKTLINSVTDAKYTVFHKGGATEFRVNQQIGGGTWVYLGTFLFDKGNTEYGRVVLSNESKENGVVVADAVRFGGGMGNIARQGRTSGLPRYLEGARYSAQWAGMPPSVYGEGTNDYTEDINARSRTVNYLSGGSVYNPDQEGRGVPFEVNLALHSDAGYKKDDGIVGSLAIHTSDFNQGKLGAGNSRLASRDLADIMLTELQNDIRSTFNTPWQRRPIWDKNYSESRLPASASMILEFLSHQNFADMKHGHDPVFKFTVARSMYKSLVRFTASQHERNYTIQPLPVQKFAIRFGEKKRTIRLSWEPTSDPLEPSARPDEYIVYTRIGQFGFDNGVRVRGTSHTLRLEEGLTYSFRVTAANAGGESFPSETLSAYLAPKSRYKALIVNAFDRLSGPSVVDYGDNAGFDLDQDPGVPYRAEISLSGRQTGFSRSRAGVETAGGWGYSGTELEGTILAGNTFDYVVLHGIALKAAGGISYVSCSRSALENGLVATDSYDLLDVFFGLQKYDPVTRQLRNRDYKTFTPEMQRILTAYLHKGGALLLSGSYIASDMTSNRTETLFTQDVLKYSYGGSARYVYSPAVSGMQRSFTLPRTIQEKSYPVVAPDCMQAENGAFPIFTYADETSAGIAYKGAYRVIALGFPFESIEQPDIRNQLMGGFMQFLLK